jgi:hypothetical protein
MVIFLILITLTSALRALFSKIQIKLWETHCFRTNVLLEIRTSVIIPMGEKLQTTYPTLS